MNFIDDHCFKMSAALAYYTIFSIGPLLLIVIWTLGFFYGEHLEGSSAKEEVMQEMSEMFGSQISGLIQTALENLSLATDSKVGIIIGLGTLVFTSTTVFVEIQDSINIIWGIKPKPKKNWLKFILNRLTSLSMILGLGFLLIASLLINSIILVLMNYFNQIIPGISNQMLDNINSGLTFVIITLIFGFIFKFLPDAKVRKRDIIGGALFTSILFMIGRYGISIYLQQNATASAFGAAGAIILLLLWVYYSAAILYYGAEFTKEHSKVFGNGIIPTSYAVKINLSEIATQEDSNKKAED
ncbi:MAG: YihY/virulence factor BrkB family protein [Flavobacteriia bacterium]|nr:YihY/virulence factor BrkB family protein [Flavobacteriia bacterium]